MDERGLCARLRRARGPGVRVRVRRGDIEDYERLAHLHYRAERPATSDLVLRADVLELGAALAQGQGRCAGVLVVSRPVLNGPWRGRAWPGRFEGGPRERARTINASLRCISRVIVDPRFRGLGVASRLVRAYLARPLTPATEALAVMGAFSPFFEAGGMTRIVLPTSERDRRILRALAREGVAPGALPAWGSPNRLRGHRGARLERALRAWASGSRATFALRDADVREIAWACASRLVAPRAAFVHGRGDWRVQPRRDEEHPEQEERG